MTATYSEWLMTQRKRNTPVGDLARDAEDDRRIQAGFETRGHLVAYLTSRGACDGAVREARASLARWRKASTA
jgi:hypothetical protein